MSTMGKSLWLKTRHCALFHVSHSFQANGTFRMGTAGRREHIACRQPLAGGWEPHLDNTNQNRGKRQFHSQGRGELLKDWQGSQVASLACLDLLAALRNHWKWKGVLPSLFKVLWEGNCLKERAPEIAAGNLLSQVFTAEVNRLGQSGYTEKQSQISELNWIKSLTSWGLCHYPSPGSSIWLVTPSTLHSSQESRDQPGQFLRAAKVQSAGTLTSVRDAEESMETEEPTVYVQKYLPVLSYQWHRDFLQQGRYFMSDSPW